MWSIIIIIIIIVSYCCICFATIVLVCNRRRMSGAKMIPSYFRDNFNDDYIEDDHSNDGGLLDGSPGHIFNACALP